RSGNPSRAIFPALEDEDVAALDEDGAVGGQADEVPLDLGSIDLQIDDRSMLSNPVGDEGLITAERELPIPAEHDVVPRRDLLAAPGLDDGGLLPAPDQRGRGLGAPVVQRRLRLGGAGEERHEGSPSHPGATTTPRCSDPCHLFFLMTLLPPRSTLAAALR